MEVEKEGESREGGRKGRDIPLLHVQEGSRRGDEGPEKTVSFSKNICALIGTNTDSFLLLLY